MPDPMMVRLGDVLALERDEVVLQPEEAYRPAGIYSFGKGVFEREPIRGADTKYSSLFRLHTNDFVLSRLNGWEGAVDVVSSEFDGCLVSSEYPTFTVDVSRADPRFLRWIARWPRFWDQLVPRGSMVRRKRVQSAQLLEVEIPLPPIEEQQRIAKRLDQVRACSRNLARCSARAASLAEALGVSVSARPDLSESARYSAGWRRTNLGSVMRAVTDRIDVEPAGSYPNLGIYSFGRGLFAKPDIEGGATSANALNRVHTGQFIYSRLFAFEGSYGFVSPEFDQYFVSNEFPTFDTDSERLEAQWLANFLKAPDRWAELASSSRGLGVRRQRVSIESVLAYEVWLPPIEQQRAMVQLVNRLEQGASRAQAGAWIGSLAPAALNEAFAGIAHS